jgi:type I restriction enzyme, S subunit
MSEAAPQTSLPSVTLGEVAESIVDGPFGSNLKTSDYVEFGVPVLQGKNITGNRFVWKEVRYISDDKARQLKRSSTVVGDHLLIKIGSIGYSAILDDLDGHDFAIIPANLARIRLDRSVVDDQYLHRVLTSDFVVRHFQKVASKTAQPALSLKKIKATQIPLPPLTDQKRIAGILDAVDALRAKRRESLAQLDTLLQSTFLDMFGDPVTNPMAWEEKAIGSTGSLVQIGPFGSLLHKEDYISGGVPLINPKHIFNGVAVVGCEETVTRTKAEELRNYLLQRGDVIMGRRGEMGRCAVVTETTAGMLCGTGSLFVRPNRDLLTALYLSKVISSESMKGQLERVAWGVTMANLNRSKIESLSIPVPPLNLQHRFTAIVESVEQQKARLRAHLAELDTLFASLQSRAFKGEL